MKHAPHLFKPWASVTLGLALAGFAFNAGAQTYSLSNTWTQVASAVPVTNNIDIANDNRGMCYGIMSNIVVVNNKGTHVIETYDGNTGLSNGVINSSGLSGGNFTLNKIGFGSDGIFYGANLETTVTGAGSAYTLYQWTNLSTAPNVAYSSLAGDAVVTSLSGKRIGDTWAITGGGTNTKVLAGVGSTNAFVLLSTSDGVTFTPTVLTIPFAQLPAPSGGVQFGFAFYTNNTFLLTPNGLSSVYLVQYPTNFASLTSPVIANIIATNAIAGIYLDLSYSPASGLLATHPNAALPINLYSLPSNNFAALALLGTTNLSFPTTSGTNGNETGDIALGGTGFSNAIYTFDTSAGIQATTISFASAALSPSITAQPVGGSDYTNVGSYVFSVSATGTQPLSYQWQYNTVSNLATASNITNATNSSYTLNPLLVSESGWYDVVISNRGGVTSSIPALLTISAPISSVVVSQLWTIPPGSNGYPYLDGTSYDTRGLAYDTNTMTVLVADKGVNFGIYVLNANTGSNLFTMNTAGIGQSGNLFSLDQIGVGDDGVLYCGNLIPAGSTAGFSLISWAAVTNTASPVQAYLGDPGSGSGDRWGDTMAVRGAGKNTQILLGTYVGFDGGPSTNAALLTTSDGVTFTSQLLNITNTAIPAGFCSLGIAFGASNTFWAKSPGYDLRQIAFDSVSGNCSVIQDIPTASNGAAAFSSMSAIALDVPNNLIAGVTFNDVPNDLSLYILGSSNAAPYLFDQTFFPSNNGNSQDNGATTVKFPRIYSLDVNNGIVALTYSVPLSPFNITNVTDKPSPGLVFTFQTQIGRHYQVQFASNLAATNAWSNVGPLILATGSTTSFTNSTPTGTDGFYRVAGY